MAHIGKVTGIFTQAPSPTGENSFPKKKTTKATVTVKGFEGDRQVEAVDADFGGHGGPLKAVCLWSSEVVQELKAAGHTLQEGTCGENICISGLPWDEVIPGTRLAIGDTLLEVTAFANLCHKQTAHFIKGNFMVGNKDGMKRVYCAVLIPGVVEEGAKVEHHVDTRGARVYATDKKVMGKFLRQGKSSNANNMASPLALVAAAALGMLAGAAIAVMRK